MHLTTFSQIILKKDSVKCLTNEQIKVINNVFLDLDECEQEVEALGKIVTIQDTMLKSKIDLLAMYKKQYEYNEELKYQLTASINTQIQRFNALESSIKKDAKQQKRKGITIGSSLGIGLSLTLGLLIFHPGPSGIVVLDLDSYKANYAGVKLTFAEKQTVTGLS